jgi:type IV secretory pathway TrbD component
LVIIAQHFDVFVLPALTRELTRLSYGWFGLPFQDRVFSHRNDVLGLMIFLISYPASCILGSGSLAITIIGGSLQWFLFGVCFSCLLAIMHKCCMRWIAKEDQHLDSF